MTKPVRSRLTETIPALILIALPVVVFTLVWNYYAVNVPKWDDHALRDFLFREGQEPSWSGKIYYLIRQHNEHRIVYDRIVTALDYGLFGKLNYRHLMVVGNLSLVGLLVLFGFMLRHSKSDRLWLFYLLPVSLVLFNLSQWENMFWGMAALQNFTVVLWVFWSIYLLSGFQNRYPNRYLYGAIALAVLATLTSGNGLLVWPIGVGILLLQQRWNDAKRWVMSTITVLVLYFVGYEKPAGNPPIRGSFTDLLEGWLAFNGSAGEAWPAGQGFQNSLVLGSLLTALATIALVLILRPLLLPFFARSIRKQASPQSVSSPAVSASVIATHSSDWPVGEQTKQTTSHTENRVKYAVIPTSPASYFFMGSFAFLLGTAAIVAWARVGFGLELLITSRYKLYSLTLLAVVYLYLIVALPQRIGRWVGIVGSVGGLMLAWLSYYSYLNETIWWRHWLLTDQQFNWTYTTNRPVATLDSVTVRYTEPAPAFYDSILPILYGPAQQSTQPLAIEENKDTFTIWESSNGRTDLCDGQSYLVARSSGPKGRVYLFPTWQNMRSPKESRFLPWRSFQAGFSATLLKIELAAGVYDLMVLTATPDGGWALHPTNQQIQSAGQQGVDIQKNW